MAPLSFSPDTSISSHTLSVGSVQPPPMDLQPAAMDSPSSLVANPLTFLQPTLQLNAAFLAAAKQYLDPVAAGISDAQSRRLQMARRKRKRGERYEDDVRVLHLKKIHLDGFGVNQVFEQTRKIVEAAAEEIELSIPSEENGIVTVHEDDEELDDSEEDSDADDESDLGEEGVDWEYDGVDDQEDAQPSDEALSADEDMDMDGADEELFAEESDDEPAETYKPDPNGLNDGFFSIDDFNKQSEFLEQQDQRGEAADSEDEEIDWTADPMTGGLGNGLGAEADASEDESDAAGPTFGNADLNAPEGESDDDEFEEGDLDVVDDGMNANNVMYADFFAPPAKKAGKNKKKRGRPNPHNFPEKKDGEEAEEVEADVNNTMARVHRDLFEDDDDAESDDDLEKLDPSDPKSRRSTHERRQAKIAEEIRKLEAANVAKREWQLSGEARAADRPLNSLLEENLEFERAGKPVPIVTAEVSEDIEALIKRRILAGEFDEVLRRRPDDLATGPKVRRGQFQLDDSKSGKGLAEIYEEEHLRDTNPDFVDAKDEKLKKEHDEISALWKKLSAKLDSLSSSHFKPKPAAPNLEIRVDAPAIEMEDARPTAGGEVAGASMLAPQEVYKPGDEKDKSEVVTKSGMPVAREEMSREEKASRRRRAKERSKKEGLNKPRTDKENKTEKKGGKQEKKQVLSDLKKGGVQIIGRKGVLTDVEGKEVKDGAARRGAGSYKL
ncbi:Mpp10 protein-domain-containing protein [Paraphoma chrysanthemicola]|uniref:Mpp10 protein-domain-containing protein n=1 Tax=Paraphoma chrysanthemicola TaxID=798071 RepID=A0A8K0RGP3_9PLEO|nr:Mpp10 protein-domain-containing protein [Paraphoma chrysanthemicola]